ncbi:MAG: ABC transporter substrate-binding protein [Cumulibacter sp.]
MKRTPMKVMTAGTVAAALLLSGCSTKASDDSGGGSDGDLKTDFGVTDDEITLLELSDLSGVFKVISLAFTNGTKVWADEVNDAGGICGRDIKLEIQDTNYKVENAVPLYEQHKDDALGQINLGGSHILAALKQKVENEKMLTVPASWASVNLETDAVMMVGQTYDVETINGLAYLQEEGLIADGDKIGHIYVDSEYGQNGLMGSKAYAKDHDITVVEAPISASDTDLTATITKLKSAGVTAIAITTPPAALGSAAVQNVQQGLEVPIIGNNPSYAPNLLEDEGVAKALEHFYMSSSVVPFSAGNDKADEVLEAAQELADDEPNIGIINGYTWGLAWQAVLEKACDNGDMTREGVVSAKNEVDSVESEGLTGALDFTVPGAPSSREAYIVVADGEKPGGLAIAKDLFSSPEAEAYKAPAQK